MLVLPLIAMFVASSVVVAALALRGSGPAQRSLRTAAGAIAEFAGLWAGCLMLNLVLGVGAVLGVRLVAGVFVSIYILNDVSVVILAAFQAVAILAWLRGDEPHAEARKAQRRRPSGAA